MTSGFMRRLLGRRAAAICLIYLALVVAVAILAPILLPGVAKESAGDLRSTFQGPNPHHLLGTDQLGRDVLQRLMVGTGVTLFAVLDAVVVVLLLGVPLGLWAGYSGSFVDRVVGWLADMTFSLPAIIVILVVVAVFPHNLTAAMVTFGFIASPGLMRVVRSATLSVREELYIAAARVAGLTTPHILLRHVLPRIGGAVIVQASLVAAAAVLIQSTLAFLNLVVAAPAPSWGGMVAEGAQAMLRQPWLIWPPGLAIAFTVLALGLLGDSLRDATTETWSNPAARGRHDGRHLPVPHPRPARDAAGVVLSVSDLNVAITQASSEVTVVDGVSFDIRKGEAVGLVGESGCGKTVTAMSILGILPAVAAVRGGEIWFQGRDLVRASETDLRRIRGRKIGFISQEPTISLDPLYRVGSQLVESLRTHHPKLSRRAARKRAVELLRQVRIPNPEGVARRYPYELSGGMAQRVAIARALAGEPDLLIADEPTTALDVTVQADVLDLLRDLQRERGMSILLVTHDWGVVADLCDRAVVMYAGQVVERADLAPLFRMPLHPYTEALMESNPHHAPELERLPTIGGGVPRPGGWPAGCHFHPRCRYATRECHAGAIPLERPVAGRETRCIHVEQLEARHAG